MLKKEKSIVVKQIFTLFTHIIYYICGEGEALK